MRYLKPVEGANTEVAVLPKLSFQGLQFGETPAEARRILKGKWKYVVCKDGADVYLGTLAGNEVQLHLSFTLLSRRLWHLTVFEFMVGHTFSLMVYRFEQLATGLAQKYGPGTPMDVFGPVAVLDQPIEDLVDRDDCQITKISWDTAGGSVELKLWDPVIENGTADPKVLISYWHEEFGLLDEQERIQSAADEL